MNSDLVSVIIPVYNAELYLSECFQSILDQKVMGLDFEVSIFDDLSTDKSSLIIDEWREKFEANKIQVIIGKNQGDGKGCGFAKNKAIGQCNGTWLCFQDADDIMMPNRIQLQLNLAKENENAIIGGNFKRTPEGATERYTKWCNRLTQEELYQQRFREVTLIMPTWFLHRNVYNKIGGFDPQKGLPEDLIFFLSHLQYDGKLKKVNECILIYRYHETMTSSLINRKVLMKYRVEAFENQILKSADWDHFMIWGCGRDGKLFYKTLSKLNQQRVSHFCEIHPQKINTSVILNQTTKHKIPIIHWSEIKPPFVTCVALDRDSDFERNVQSLGFVEGKDYFYFV